MGHGELRADIVPRNATVLALSAANAPVPNAPMIANILIIKVVHEHRSLKRPLSAFNCVFRNSKIPS